MDKRSLAYSVGAAFLGLAWVAALATLDPATSPLFPPCMWRAATGWLCPGCGSARALHALLRGHIMVALETNPLAVVTATLLPFDFVGRWRRHDGGWTNKARTVHLRAIAAVTVLFWILRNVIK